MDPEKSEASTASSVVNPDKYLESPGEARCIHAHGKVIVKLYCNSSCMTTNIYSIRNAVYYTT